MGPAEQNEDGLPSWVEPRPRTGLERLRRWWRERRSVRHPRDPEPDQLARWADEGGHPPPPHTGPGVEPKGMQ